MFTGIITHVGRVESIGGGSLRDLVIGSDLPPERIGLGASVAHGGVCLTVVEKGPGWHRVQASGETLGRSTLGRLRQGERVNLEGSLRLGDELGGHLVFGHVDAVGTIEALAEEGGSWHLRVRVPAGLSPLIAVKGSVAVDGISLTVTEAGPEHLACAIIPHTWAHTTLRDRRPGDPVNLEADMLARYVARQLGRG